MSKEGKTSFFSGCRPRKFLPVVTKENIQQSYQYFSMVPFNIQTIFVPMLKYDSVKIQDSFGIISEFLARENVKPLKLFWNKVTILVFHNKVKCGFYILVLRKIRDFPDKLDFKSDLISKLLQTGKHMKFGVKIRLEKPPKSPSQVKAKFRYKETDENE